MAEPESDRDKPDFSDGDDPVVASTEPIHTHQEQHANHPSQNGKVGGNKAKTSPTFRQKRRYVYCRRLRRAGPDRHIELGLSAAIALFAVLQFGATLANNYGTSKQVNKIITAANGIDKAAESFSASADRINSGISGAVTKLGEQADKMDAARSSAEQSSAKEIAELQTQVQMAERPLVIISAPELYNLGAETTQKAGIRPEQGIAVHIQYVNVGKSYALKFRMNRHFTFGEDAVNEIQPDPEPQVMRGDMPPNAVPKIVDALPLKRTPPPGIDPFYVDPGNIKPWDGQYPLIVYGAAIYQDRFGNTYCSPYLFLMWKNTLWASGTSIEKHGEKKEIRKTSDLCPKGAIR